MFGDSNGSAVVTLSVLSVLTFLKKENLYEKDFSLHFFVLIFLLVSNLSRAVIIGYSLLILYLFLFYKKDITLKMFILLFGIILLFLVLLPFVSKDPSGKTKFMLFNKTFEYIKTTDILSLLMGNGCNSSPLVIGKSAHSLYLTYLIEYGLIGFFLLFVLFLFVFIDTGKYFFYIAIPYFVAAFSWSPVAMPYIYCSFLLIKHSDRLIRKK
jgi:O-antigen ligase